MTMSNDYILGNIIGILKLNAEPASGDYSTSGGRLDVALDLDKSLTSDQLSEIALRAPTIKLRGLTDDITEHHAPNGRSFTVHELLDAVTEHERCTRRRSEWFGG